MNNKMIVALDSVADFQGDMITNYLRQQGWNIWHWLSDVWLLADVPPQISPRDLWERLESIAGPQPIKGFVMTTGQDPKFWGSNNSDSWKWMGRLWGTPDFSTEDSSKVSYQNQV